MGALYRAIHGLFTVGKGVVSFAFCIILSLIFLQSSPSGRQTFVDLAFSSVLFPVQLVLSQVERLESLQSANESLRKENARLMLENSLLIQKKAEYMRLRDMVSFKAESEFDLILARVIARNPGKYQTSFVINRGLADSVGPNMPVITSKGLVGRISKVFPNHSHVKLLQDPVVKVSVIENRTRSVGIMETPDSYHVRVELSRYSGAQEGDTLITSGYGGIFPKGLMVGTISNFSEGNIAVMHHAEVDLFQDPAFVEELFILKKEDSWVYQGGDSAIVMPDEDTTGIVP